MTEKTFSFGGLLSQSWDRLRGNRLKAFGMVLLLYVINGVVQSIAGAAALIVSVLLMPLQIGLMLFFLRLARREPAPMESLFEPFSKYGHMLWGMLRPTFVILLWALPAIFCGLAAAIAAGCAAKTEQVGYFSIFLALLAVALLLAILPIIAGYRYALTPYIILDDLTLPVKDAMRRSSDLMCGYKLRLMGYGILLGLIVVPLTILTLCIALFWLVPLCYAFGAVFYLAVKEVKEPEAPAEAKPETEAMPEPEA